MKIVIGMDLNPEQRAPFLAAAEGHDVLFVSRGGITAENAADAEVILGNPPHAILPQLKKLRMLQLNSAGNDGYDTAIAACPNAKLYNGSGAYGLAISEHMLCVLLMLMKKMHLYRDIQPTGQWHNFGQVQSIWHSRILVLGMGNIGTAFAERVKAMGAYVIGMKRTPGDVPPCCDEMHTIEHLDEILPTVDAVCMSLPNTPATQGILSAERIASMKPGAYIVNVGRGSAIDQPALIDALNSGRLGGAALDVMTPEPLPENHLLWTARNCLITPHISGGYNLPQTYVYVQEIALRNLKAYLSGAPLINEVNLNIGY